METVSRIPYNILIYKKRLHVTIASSSAPNVAIAMYVCFRISFTFQPLFLLNLLLSFVRSFVHITFTPPVCSSRRSIHSMSLPTVMVTWHLYISLTRSILMQTLIHIPYCFTAFSLALAVVFFFVLPATSSTKYVFKRWIEMCACACVYAFVLVSYTKGAHLD